MMSHLMSAVIKMQRNMPYNFKKSTQSDVYTTLTITKGLFCAVSEDVGAKRCSFLPGISAYSNQRQVKPVFPPLCIPPNPEACRNLADIDAGCGDDDESSSPPKVRRH